ncbi:hypothetical protein SNEBB_011318 [Seison nebaliae]|nr:hypothetical protein SNEBB_011318 [Seison nebaliae]
MNSYPTLPVFPELTMLRLPEKYNVVEKRQYIKLTGNRPYEALNIQRALNHIIAKVRPVFVVLLALKRTLHLTLITFLTKMMMVLYSTDMMLKRHRWKLHNETLEIYTEKLDLALTIFAGVMNSEKKCMDYLKTGLLETFSKGMDDPTNYDEYYSDVEKRYVTGDFFDHISLCSLPLLQIAKNFYAVVHDVVEPLVQIIQKYTSASYMNLLRVLPPLTIAMDTKHRFNLAFSHLAREYSVFQQLETDIKFENFYRYMSDLRAASLFEDDVNPSVDCMQKMMPIIAKLRREKGSAATMVLDHKLKTIDNEIQTLETYQSLNIDPLPATVMAPILLYLLFNEDDTALYYSEASLNEFNAVLHGFIQFFIAAHRYRVYRLAVTLKKSEVELPKCADTVYDLKTLDKFDDPKFNFNDKKNGFMAKIFVTGKKQEVTLTYSIIRAPLTGIIPQALLYHTSNARTVPIPDRSRSRTTRAHLKERYSKRMVEARHPSSLHLKNGTDPKILKYAEKGRNQPQGTYPSLNWPYPEDEIGIPEGEFRAIIPFDERLILLEKEHRHQEMFLEQQEKLKRLREEAINEMNRAKLQENLPSQPFNDAPEEIAGPSTISPSDSRQRRKKKFLSRPAIRIRRAANTVSKKVGQLRALFKSKKKQTSDTTTTTQLSGSTENINRLKVRSKQESELPEEDQDPSVGLQLLNAQLNKGQPQSEAGSIAGDLDNLSLVDSLSSGDSDESDYEENTDF